MVIQKSLDITVTLFLHMLLSTDVCLFRGESKQIQTQLRIFVKTNNNPINSNEINATEILQNLLV